MADLPAATGQPTGPGEGPGEEAGERLRLVSYNVRDLLDDRHAVEQVLRSCRADVVCLQEAPRRWFAAHRMQALARRTALVWAAGGRGSGGTAVLVHRRWVVQHARVHRLPVGGWFTRTRGVALARLRSPRGIEVVVLSVHLPLRAEQRLDHCRRIVAHLGEGVGPTSLHVLAGDLNEPPGGPSWLELTASLRDAAELVRQDGPTYPSRRPLRRIDAVLVSAGVRVGSVRVAGEQDGLDRAVLVAASDHLPLVAELGLGVPDQD